MTQREIKFRAWDKISSKMRDIIEIRLVEFPKHSYDYMLLDPTPSSPLNWILRSKKDTIITRLTGLKTKSNCDVYEGDIVSYGTPYHGEIKNILKGRIIYNDFCGAFQIEYMNALNNFVSDFAHKFTIIEVIGNIYSDPELLES